MHYQSVFWGNRDNVVDDNSQETGPIKKVLVSALIVVVIVGLMVGLMALGELIGNWL